MEGIEEILLTAIAIERYGQDYYKRFASSITDHKGSSLMLGLARDEKDHEEIISKEYVKHFKRAPPKKLEIDIGTRVVKEIFALKKGETESEITLEILQIGIVVEQKSIDFYSSKSKMTEDIGLRRILSELVDIEKGHKAMLEENLFHLRQDGTWWGYVPILEG